MHAKNPLPHGTRHDSNEGPYACMRDLTPLKLPYRQLVKIKVIFLTIIYMHSDFYNKLNVFFLLMFLVKISEVKSFHMHCNYQNIYTQNKKNLSLIICCQSLNSTGWMCTNWSQPIVVSTPHKRDHFIP